MCVWVIIGNCVERIGKIVWFVMLLLIFVVWIEFVVVYGGVVDEVILEDGFLLNLWVKGLIFVKVYCLIIVFFVMLLGGILFYFVLWNVLFLVLGI